MRAPVLQRSMVITRATLAEKKAIVRQLLTEEVRFQISPSANEQICHFIRRNDNRTQKIVSFKDDLRLLSVKEQGGVLYFVGYT